MKRVKYVIKLLLLLLPAVLVILPVVVLLSVAITDSEMMEDLGPLIRKTQEFISWRFIPEYPSFSNYVKLLFRSPEFYVLFWNSVFMVGMILLGQVLVAETLDQALDAAKRADMRVRVVTLEGVPAAWGCAVYETRGSRLLFSLYVVLMLIPFQVTMLSSYLALNRLKLLNTYYAVIMPSLFSTLPVFLCYGGFREIPAELLEEARIDGAGEWALFWKLGLPIGKGGLLSAMVLGFLEYWNLMEQPMAFLKDASLWPLSLYLPQITLSQAGFAFCASVMMLIPAVFVFALGQDHLEQGIIYSGLKG